MDAGRSTSPADESLLKLLAMFFSPLALRHLLERPPASHDVLEVVGVRYRNSLFLFRCIDAHIKRSAAVVLVCFFVQPVIAFLVPAGFLYVAVVGLMLTATLHTGALGIYRQVLNDRISRYADILGVERPAASEKSEEFPRSDLDRHEPRLKSTRKLPLRERRPTRPPR